MQKINITLEKLFFATKCRTKTELATKLGITCQGLSLAEAKPSPSIDGRILRVAMSENISVDWLFGISGQIPANMPDNLIGANPTC